MQGPPGAVCPSCSRLYQADAWQLVAAGIRGGKGVDAGVVEHPQLFVTLTAPSFGPVHTGRRGLGMRPGVPAPEESRDLSRTGGRWPASRRHGADDPLARRPLCPECFDYRGAVLWNAHVPAALGPHVATASTARWPGPAAMSDRETAGRRSGSPT